jgi:hypothetical protein
MRRSWQGLQRCGEAGWWQRRILEAAARTTVQVGGGAAMALLGWSSWRAASVRATSGLCGERRWSSGGAGVGVARGLVLDRRKAVTLERMIAFGGGFGPCWWSSVAAVPLPSCRCLVAAFILAVRTVSGAWLCSYNGEVLRWRRCVASWTVLPNSFEVWRCAMIG